jgi:DNA-binding MurR/RpiR family transcriptional regulator
MEELVDIGRRDVVIVFDYRRYQTDTIEFTRDAVRRRATVVAVTDPLLSPAAHVARHVLTFQVQAGMPLDTPIGGFALVEVLLAEAARRLEPTARSRLRALEELNHYWMWDRPLVDPKG